MKELDTDVYRFIESLKYRPETYKTILGEHYDNKSTDTNKIRKKISAFVRQGLISSGILDGVSGTKIFYSLEKNYYIFIVEKNGYHHYYCSDISEGDGPEVIFFNAFILQDGDWVSLKNVSIPKESIRRWF